MIMRFCVFAIISLLILAHTHAQNKSGRTYSSSDPAYKFNIDTAYSLIDGAKFKEAIPFLETALKITDKSYGTRFKLARCYSETGLTDKCFDLLYNICQTNWDGLEVYIHQQESSPPSVFHNLYADPRWAELKACPDKARNEHNAALEKADMLFNNADYIHAIPYFKTVLEIDDNTHLIEMKLAKAYNFTGETEQCFDILNKISNDYEWMQEFMEIDTSSAFAFSNLVADKRWTALKARVDSEELQHNKGYNKSLRRTLREIKTTDQLYRSMRGATDRSKPGKQALIDSLWRLQTLIDSLNLIQVIGIFGQYGYPGDSLVGADLSSVAWLIIQHADLKYQEKYLSMLKEAADRKQLQWSALALLIDRIEMGNSRPQIYGSQLRCDSEGKCVIYKILDEAHVNKRRYEVGLGPLQDYVMQWGITWTPPKEEK
jgi:tetratricopeptide (TPR) repeat protein